MEVAGIRLSRQRVAMWMAIRGYATGHGDTIEALLAELEAQAKERGADERRASAPQT